MARRLAILATLFVGFFFFHLGNATNGTGLPSENSCSAVRRLFVMKGIGPSHLVPDKPLKGDDLELCPSTETCCSQQMEEKFRHEVQKDFKTLLQSSGSYLKTLIATSATKFKDTFLDMIQVSQNSTTAIFTEVYQFIEQSPRVPLSQLFADLLAYMSGQDVDLEDRVNSFFYSLFPLAFHHSVNSKQKEFSHSYQECLSEVQAEVRPFGDLPENIISHVSHSFEAARTFLEALQVGVEVLNTTEHMEFGAGCRATLVKLTYCSHCQGLQEVKPCAGLCLNAMRGCLASVSELDSSWSEYVAALERLTSGMVGSNNIEQVLSSLDTKISQTMLYVMDNTAEITKRVKQKCGHLRRVTRDITTTTSAPIPMRGASSTRQVTSDTSLYIQLQIFVQKMAEYKLYYSTLADDLCSDKGLPSAHSSNHRCWNGHQIGEYTDTVAGVGISAQKYNPEMRPPKVRDAAVDTLIEKLRHITQVLTTRITPVLQSDESVIIEPGSGSGHYRPSDDEDYDGGSGSGDYGSNKGDKTDLHFEGSDRGSSGKKSDSRASYVASRSIFLSIVTPAILIFTWTLHEH